MRRRVVTGQHDGPIDALVARPEMCQREPIAGGLRGGFPATDLAQVPVVELVAIEKAQDLAPRPEAGRPAEPLESDPIARPAAGREREPPAPRVATVPAPAPP